MSNEIRHLLLDNYIGYNSFHLYQAPANGHAHMEIDGCLFLASLDV